MEDQTKAMTAQQFKLKLHSIKRSLNFSTPQLIIFVVAFGLIGYFLWHSFASAPVVATLEAEQMALPAGGSVITDTTASAGKAIQLLNNGTASGSVSFTSSVTSFAVIARGTQCQGSPTMSVALDGTNYISNTAVSNTAWASFSATPANAIASGTHSLAISFANDYTKTKGNSRNNCSRALYIDVTTFYGPTSVTPAPTVTLSASPTSVTSGTASTLTWASTDASSCSASGSWSGSQPTSGSQSTGALNQTSTYSLTCTGSGGSATASATVTVSGGVPANTSLPVISGTTTVGSNLTTTNGTWTNSPSSYNYTWYDCDSSGSNCTGIANSSSSSYTLTSTDANHTIEVHVTAVNSYGTSAVAISAPTAMVTPGTTGTTGSITFTGDFETGNLNQWDWGSQCANTGTLSDSNFTRGNIYVNQTKVLQGTYSAQIDMPTSSVNRACEVLHKSLMDVGGDAYYSEALYFPSNWTEPSSAFWGAAQGQFNYTAILGPPIGVFSHSNYVNLVMQTGLCDSTNGCQYTSESGGVAGHGISANDRIVPTGTALAGRWVELVVHAHWAADSTGLVEGWWRYPGGSWQKTVSISGFPSVQWSSTKPVASFCTYMGESNCSYTSDKTGFYTGPSSNTFTVNIDGFYKGTSFDIVASKLP